MSAIVIKDGKGPDRKTDRWITIEPADRGEIWVQVHPPENREAGYSIVIDASVLLNALNQLREEKAQASGARTPLGARLRVLRSKIVESGTPLLGWEALEQELADRRGGVG